MHLTLRKEITSGDDDRPIPEVGVELKVGQLAKRTGLTVRTLHHYDEIGLLRASSRTPAGHRLYGPADIERLQQIASLRQLGLGLPDVAECLDGDGASVNEVLARHIAFLRQRIDSETQLVTKLEGILEQSSAGKPLSSDQLLETIEMTNLFDRYYSPEQLSHLRTRAREVGPERIQDAQTEWAELFASLDAARLKGLAPDSDEVRPLAEKAQALIAEFTGGNAGIRASLGRMVEEERPTMHALWGVSEELGAYVQEAMAAAAE